MGIAYDVINAVLIDKYFGVTRRYECLTKGFDAIILRKCNNFVARNQTLSQLDVSQIKGVLKHLNFLIIFVFRSFIS
ncbi:hypothetical protein DSECCO2_635480 [anaerobic digester metagenome]